MKQLLIVSVILFALAAILVTAGVVYAQTQILPSLSGNGWGMGGMMGGYAFDEGYGPWNHMQRGGMWGGQYGPMHAAMVAAVADGLGISSEALDAALADGKTMWQVAEEQGLSSDEIVTLMENAHDIALEQAVADGVITADQAEWMDGHMQQMLNGNGRFGGHCSGRNLY